METFPALLLATLCVESNTLVTGEFPSQRPVTRSFDVFIDLRLNKRLSKQSSGRWFETPSSSLWHMSSVVHTICILVFCYIFWLPATKAWYDIFRSHRSCFTGTGAHCNDVIMSAMAFQINKKIRAPSHCFLWGESPVDRWIPGIKGQWRGKGLHWVTSSWLYKVSWSQWYRNNLTDGVDYSCDPHFNQNQGRVSLTEFPARCKFRENLVLPSTKF